VADLAGAIGIAPVCAGVELSPVTATLMYERPDTFVMKIVGDMDSEAAIRRATGYPFVRRNRNAGPSSAEPARRRPGATENAPPGSGAFLGLLQGGEN
jgi:hypothetical protein